jgi:ADP-heptose:LPS heptosyltransferase
MLRFLHNGKPVRGTMTRPREVLSNPTPNWSQCLSGRVRKAPKECLVIRYGALGDAVWMTPVLRQLKRDGWYIVYNTTEYSGQVLRDCPYIDEFLIQPQDAVTGDQLSEYWAALGREFDRVINFSGSVEGKLLVREGSEEYDWSHHERHRRCNVNYQDATMAAAGYPDMKGERPELHFSESEEVLVRSLMKTHLKDNFVVALSLSGSSFHKSWPWSPYLCGEIYKNHGREVIVISLGDTDCQIIEPNMPNVIRKAGHLPVRSAMLLTKYVHLVVGPETGILNAAAAFPTPKIVFLSHSSEENLTRYWENVTPLHGHCPEWPCHRLVYSNSCPKGAMDLAPMCSENLLPQTVYAAFEYWFRKWKAGEPPYGTEPAQTLVERGVPRSLRRKVRV